MPTYVYRREDGTSFEIQQRITADPLETCPTTGQPVKRVITGNTGIIFKGSGFYITDYDRSGSNGTSPAVSNGSESTSSESASTESDSSTKETTSASASDSKTSSDSSSSASGSA